ncbi:MAG: deoxyribonuclease V [Sedimentisphaerales bacterium]|nr:deoxyribonuclease V [Sedimentisphaerales bacterium]
MKLQGTNLSELTRQQQAWAKKVRPEPINHPIRVVAGADVAFSSDGNFSMAAVVALSLPKLEILSITQAIQKVTIPYIPGFLSFREAPVVIAAAQKLPIKPDVLLVDGQGLAHPRRFGLACHVGVELDWPTIGCAKSRLLGTYREPAPQKGASCRLMDGPEIIGKVLRSRYNVNCLFISIGHRITLVDAVKITLSCCRKYRLPEPARLAHQLVTKIRKQHEISPFTSLF